MVKGVFDGSSSTGVKGYYNQKRGAPLDASASEAAVTATPRTRTPQDVEQTIGAAQGHDLSLLTKRCQ